MKTVEKSVLIWYSAEEMFALVTDIAQYPAFLPWCDRAEVLAQDASGATARIGIALAGLHQSFSTRNTHGQGPGGSLHVGMALVDGPFSQLDGAWSFTPIGPATPANAAWDATSTIASMSPSQRACRVALRLNYGFNNRALAALVGPVFDKIAGSMVDAFVKRAEQVYA